MLFKLFKNMVKPSNIPPKPVGRWIVNDGKEAFLRASWANMDCCGDSLCGDPKKFKEVRKSSNK